jgi:hypothetical protein
MACVNRQVLCKQVPEGKEKEGRMMILSLPLSVTIPRKTKEDKVFTLNLNVYRNAHHMTMNQAKILWKDTVERLLIGKPLDMPEPPYLFTYRVFPANNRVFDLGNVLPAVQKFTDDALQDLCIIRNDNYKFIRAVDYRFGRVDKENPRIELEITHWEEA